MLTIGFPVYSLTCSLSFFQLLLATHFASVGLSARHFLANWLPMIGARQSSGINYRSLLTATYPTRGKSTHNLAESAGVIANGGFMRQ